MKKERYSPHLRLGNALANRLDHQDKKGNNRSFWWLGIAASIVGVILVTTFVFDKPETKISEPTIVDINNNEKPKTNVVVSEDIETQNQESVKNSKPEIKLANEEHVVSQKAKSSELIVLRKKR